MKPPSDGALRPDLASFDSTTREAREVWLVDALRKQVAYMRATVPFWRERLDGAGVAERQIESLADLARIPVWTKQELRAQRPATLLPVESLGQLRVCRWTSGSSGRPTVNFWSDSDWAGLVAGLGRALRRQAPIPRPTAFNAFSQSHVTGPVFSAVMRHLGGAVFERSPHPEEQFSTRDQIELFDVDTLIIPASSMRGKAVGMVALLAEDPSLLARHAVRWVLGSAWVGAMNQEDARLTTQLRDQGVEVVSRLYGCSEVAPFSVSCTVDHDDMHVAEGHVLVEVVDATGTQVRSGQSGRILVSHLSGIDDDGRACVYRGTQFLRLAAGDGATWIDEACTCGLTTPRLRGIQRIPAAA
ncbi:MAG: hypothetical protein JWP01_2100 [Myxococcales bacterium]|nr:hypothetical protein [Myxococcales bacterium]